MGCGSPSKLGAQGPATAVVRARTSCDKDGAAGARTAPPPCRFQKSLPEADAMSTSKGQPQAAPVPSPVPLDAASESSQASLLCAVPRPSVDVTQRGVTLSFLQLLVSSGAVPASWTIQQVVDGFVRPRTAGPRCCLFELLPSAAVGKPRFFVSHTWSRTLGELLGLLQGHFAREGMQGGEDVVLWLDIIAINQHPYEQRGCLLEDDVSRLAQVVAAADRTLFCLDPDCTSLTRIWCLFEVWQTFLAKGVQGLLVLASSVDVHKLKDVFETLDVLQAQATQPQDRDRILTQIGSSIGAVALNLQLKSAIVDSAVYEAQHSLAQGGAALAEVQTKAGVLLSARGMCAEAEPLLRQALLNSSQALGPENRSTLACINSLALCLQGQGRYDDAEVFYHQAYDVSMRVLGDDHRDTIGYLNNAALCINDQGRYAEAEPLYRAALEALTQTLGPDHPQTEDTINNLALCVDDQGRHAEAEPLYRQILDTRTRALGPDHPLTISTVSNLALCLHGQARYAEAEAMCRQALDGRTRVLGLDHPDTITSINNLANDMYAQARTAEAEQMYRQALDARTRVLGPDHPDTTVSMTNLGICITAQGRHAEAETLYRPAVEAMTRTLGPDHPHTLTSIGSLANCIQNQGYSTKAEPLFRQMVEARTRALGPDHPRTIDSVSNLATCLHSQRRYAEAELLYRQVVEARTRVFGPDHPSTATAISNLTMCVNAQGRR